jgi:dinuclear metal center YbgI/SA1388 family protein
MARLQGTPPSPRAVARFLDQALKVARFSDSALNGLQVEGARPVRLAAAAVDASLATFQAAARAGADLLVVHHGIFWGKPYPLTGAQGRRLKFLFESGMSLYASHLPLDAHPVLGNNACLARALGLKKLKLFGEYHGHAIGWSGSFPAPVTRADLARKLERALGTAPRVLPLGPERIQSVAVVSGGGGDMAQQAWEGERKIEAFITGEASHAVYHPCRESGLNLYLGGHYATEVFGVQALARLIQATYRVRTVFIDLPTGM